MVEFFWYWDLPDLRYINTNTSLKLKFYRRPSLKSDHCKNAAINAGRSYDDHFVSVIFQFFHFI